ncbi:MAG: hypothetical protein IH621_18495 [Krumholzibacteria bacterium]|nr:hypothetical protein [Candidatus Krumholzibacteria bacterium]
MTDIRYKTIHAEDGGDDLHVLTSPHSLMDKVGLGADPTDFGLPDLLEDGLSRDEQDRRLLSCIGDHLFILKDGRKLPIVVIPPMLEFLSDLFYERVQQAILWKPRGGGGSLAAAILIWLMMVYRNKSFIDMAGSGEQAKRVYEYTTQFWFCVPGLAEALLEKDPLQSLTQLKNGVSLSCVPASEKAARGKHTPGFVADESCQEDPRIGRVLQAAVQGVLSEPNFTIVLLSTFHVPFGFFQEAWDMAQERGFARYRWNVYDCMARCQVGLEDATPGDPDALSYCRQSCPLTDVVPDYNADGEQTGEHFDGCNGRARHTAGHLSRDNVLKAKMLNRGTDVWEVEHECKRPKASGMIYDPEKVQAAVTPLSDIVRPTGSVRRAVGIDWGRFAVAVLAERAGDHVVIPEARIFDSRPAAELIAYLDDLRRRVGDFMVYADAENAYGNLDCRNAGFETVPVPFNKRKDEGIENLTRYFEHGKIKIADDGHLQVVVRQLLRFHRDESGRIVKKDDHGPDALMCALLPFPFVDEFDSAISQLLSTGDRERLKITNKLLDACIRDYKYGVVPPKRQCSMGVSMGTSSFYVVISEIDEDGERGRHVRKAHFIGRVKDFDDLDWLMEKYDVLGCIISAQPEPHLVQRWRKEPHHGHVYIADLLNDGASKPDWPKWTGTVTVDRTFLLNSAYDEIREGRWWLPAQAASIDNGEFYAQVKAPSRVRDLTSGDLKYRWTETGALDFYRYAHAFDHLYGAFRRRIGVVEYI